MEKVEMQKIDIPTLVYLWEKRDFHELVKSLRKKGLIYE